MTRQRIKTRSRTASVPFVALLIILIASFAQAQQEGARLTLAKSSTATATTSTAEWLRLQALVPKSEPAGLVADSSSALSFLSPLVFDTDGDLASSVVVADVNGDGKPDLLVAGENCPQLCPNSLVSVLLGNEDGTFQPAVTYSGVETFTVADVNGDGKLDIVAIYQFCPNSGNGCVGVLLGNGDGTFQNAVTSDLGGVDARSIAVADLNGDGKLDVVVAHFCDEFVLGGCPMTSPGSLSVLLGNGDGTFQTALTYSAGGYLTSSVAVGDLNGDGKPDLAVANQCAQPCEFYGEGSVSVLLGNGDGTFQAPVNYDPGGENTSSVLAVDLNQDNDLDLVADNSESAAVLLGNGDGTFKSAATYNGSGITETIADLNRDGKLDLLSTGGAHNIYVLLGNGDGTFQPAQGFRTGVQALFAAAVGDVNGDGWPDVAFVSRHSFESGVGDGQVGILLNNTGSLLIPSTTLLLSSLNPSFEGQPVTLTANASSSAGLLPDGDKVTFYYYGAPGVIGSALLSAGSASVTTSSLPTGNPSVVAIYGGNGHNGPSMSPVLSQVVKPTTKSVTSTRLACSLNPSIYGQNVTWTATVTTAGSVPPTGRVNFALGGHIISTVALSPSGVATLNKSKLNADSYQLTAVYVGDANNLSSKSPVLNQVVTQTTSSAKLTSSPNPSTAGEAVTFTATIKSPTVEPTGPVTFSSGKTVLGTAQLSNGKARFTTSTLATGSTTVTATYTGDSNIAKSSASVTQTVQP